jgi:hypothetical protein
VRASGVSGGMADEDSTDTPTLGFSGYLLPAEANTRYSERGLGLLLTSPEHHILAFFPHAPPTSTLPPRSRHSGLHPS